MDLTEGEQLLMQMFYDCKEFVIVRICNIWFLHDMLTLQMIDLIWDLFTSTLLCLDVLEQVAALQFLINSLKLLPSLTVLFCNSEMCQQLSKSIFPFYRYRSALLLSVSFAIRQFPFITEETSHYHYQVSVCACPHWCMSNRTDNWSIHRNTIEKD